MAKRATKKGPKEITIDGNDLDPDPLPVDVNRLEIFSIHAKEILATRAWIDNGCVVNNDVQRILGDYSQGESEWARQLCNPLPVTLEAVTRTTAHILWHYRGRIVDSNEERMKADYHDAKRYIAYLLAQAFLNRCSAPNQVQDCFAWVQKEFFHYLVGLSLEEYVRFSAYFKWDLCGHEVTSEKQKMDSYYFDALNSVNGALWNCKNWSPDDFTDHDGYRSIRALFPAAEKCTTPALGKCTTLEAV